MLTSEQSELGAQVLAFTKVTIDSINVKSLRNHLEVTDKSIKSISLMETLLEMLESPNLSALSGLLKAFNRLDQLA